MRLGITTPLFTITPDGHAPWEADAELADIVPLVEAADRLGYEYVTCSEHVVGDDHVLAAGDVLVPEAVGGLDQRHDVAELRVGLPRGAGVGRHREQRRRDPELHRELSCRGRKR